jgi:predicted N-acyltransferase
MDVRILCSLEDVSATEWNRLCDEHPLLRHEFLVAMERHDCVSRNFGWQSAHITVYDGETLVGACPAYLKTNSYGEFVFDHTWADAYQRAGLPWYPKLVSAVPYTPATGNRLLTAPGSDRDGIRKLMIEAAISMSREQELSSAHFLFTTEAETQMLEQHGLMRRLGCQFHWHNQGYRCFDDFLAGLSSSKRKKIRRERRDVSDAGLDIEIVNGLQANDEQIRAASHFYRKTFDEKWGTATFNEAFFREISRSMGEQLILFFARDKQQYVAGTICYRSADTLYGRHWGCDEFYNHLHFELCYYQGIDYCIREGIKTFEPGAQGEHKIARGFMPTPTWSAHWIEQPQFRQAIGNFLEHETLGMRRYIEELTSHSPYRSEQRTATAD